MGAGDEYDKLLTIELTEEPDVYQEMLEELMARCLGPDGRLQARYKEKFDEVEEV